MTVLDGLECYDLSWRYRDDTLQFEALAPDGDGGKRVVRGEPPFAPYCYIEEDALELDPLQVTGCSIGDGAPDGYLKIEGDHPRDIKDFRDRYAFQTYEADVRFANRLAIDTDLEFVAPEPEDTLYFDIEVDDRGTFMQPDEAANRIISIAGVGGDGREIYYDDADEEELIRGFLREADDYVALVGWNSEGYDFEYLENRCVEHGLGVDWRRWVRHDLMPLYDMLGVPTKTVSTKLDDTGERELGEGKTGVKAGGGNLWELWHDDPGELKEYNVRDCDIVRRIDEKFDGLVKLLHVISDLCNYAPGETIYETRHGQVKFAIGMVVDAKLLEVARRKGIPQPNRGAFEKPDDFPGGYVLEPTPGMYDSVVVPDYSGMYPNIVRSWNFGRETWVDDEQLVKNDDGVWRIQGGEHHGRKAIKGESGGFVHPEDGPRSVPAEAADELVDMREGASDIVDKGVKAVNNTLYGVFASDFHRYFGKHSENITLIGQRLTGIVEKIANSGHEHIRRVIYGDTDSVMLDMGHPDDPIGAAHQIAEDLEREMQEWARDRGALAQHLELDVDDVYDGFYIGDKKKRYFGHRIFDGERCDNFKMRGFEARKGDWPQPVRDFQLELMKAKIAGDDVKGIIDEYRDKLYDGEWDAEMATQKSLGQPVSEYKGSTPPLQARAAEAIREEFGESAIQVGDKVGYIKLGPGTDEWTWVHDGEVGRDLNARHYEFLWQEKFASVMDSIDVNEYEQTGLGAFV